MLNDDNILCPLIDNGIDVGDCVIYTDVVDRMLKESCIPEEFMEKENWREICKKCKFHNM